MPKITNPNYLRFREGGWIDLINLEQVEKALSKVTGKNAQAGRALIVCLYYSGCRPAEALNLLSKDIKKENNWIIIHFGAVVGATTYKIIKHGQEGDIKIPYAKKFIKGLWDYSSRLPPEMFLFHAFKTDIKKTIINKRGELKEYTETTGLVRYYIKKWFTGVVEGGVVPYLLRHSRMSQLIMSGKSLEKVRQFKRAKRIDSVLPYSHLNPKAMEEIGKAIK